MSVLSLVPEDKLKDQRTSLESVYSSNSRLSLLQKRKRLNPLRLALGMSASQQQQRGDRFVTQRVLSAKTHRVKQLQNQLADAHYHLQELGNENKLLRALQKKQEIALQRYENSNAELPQVLSSHSEELRVQQSKYKLARQQLRELEQRLRDREQQLQALRDEHQHLLDLTRDKNLLEREKLQAQVSELTTRVQQQHETISTLQRRIALEAKNFKHQLQTEINKHRDTRHDLDLAINNADKLSTIIEMKEKIISTVASRGGGTRSPTKAASATQFNRPTIKAARPHEDHTLQIDRSVLSRLGENSRALSSALSEDEPRYTPSRSHTVSSRSTPGHAPKPSSGILDLAKTVQDGMSDLTINDNRSIDNNSPDGTQKMHVMKMDLMNKIKNNEEPSSRKASALRRKSTEESIEEQIVVEVERPKSRGRKNSIVSFYESTRTEEASVSINNYGNGDEAVPSTAKRDGSASERKISGKSVEKYCKDIFEDIEKSSRAIDAHVRQLSAARGAGDRLVQQLRAVDRVQQLVAAPGDALAQLDDSFPILGEPSVRGRSLSGRRGRPGRDADLTNQDLLDDLLGKK